MFLNLFAKPINAKFNLFPSKDNNLSEPRKKIDRNNLAFLAIGDSVVKLYTNNAVIRTHFLPSTMPLIKMKNSRGQNPTHYNTY